MTNLYIQKNSPGNNMQQQLFGVLSPNGMNASGVGNMPTNLIHANGTVSPQANGFPNDIVSQTRGPSQSSTSQWQTTQQVPSQQYVNVSNFANTRQPTNQPHAAGTYPVNQEYNISLNEEALSWTKETNYTTQAAQECITSVMSHAKNTHLNPQQMMNIENMQNQTCFPSASGNVTDLPNQMTLIQSSPLPQQYIRSKAIVESKHVWPPKFDSRLPTQPVQCQQSMQLQPLHVQNQYGTQIQQPLQNQFAQRQTSVNSQQPEQWQQQLQMQQPMFFHKTVNQQQLIQPQNQQQPVQNQPLVQQQKLPLLQQLLQPMQQQVQQQQFFQNQQSVQFQQQMQVGQLQQQLQCQQPVQLQHPMQPLQAMHEIQSGPRQQLLQPSQQMQHTQAVGYNNENMKNQLASDRRGEMYISGHQPQNTTIEKTSLIGNGYSLSDITHVATPLDDTLRQSSFEQHKTNSQPSHQTKPGTFQNVFQNAQQFTSTRYDVQDQSLQVPDKSQLQGTSPTYGRVQAKDLVKESGVPPANSVESELDTRFKDLHQLYTEIIKTKYHFLHLCRKFQDKRRMYQSLKKKLTQNPSSKSLARSQKANGIVVPTDGTQLSKNPEGQLCNQNLIIQNTKAINDTESTIIVNDHMCNLESIQQVNTSPTLASAPLSHLSNDVANPIKQSINCPEGQYLQVTTKSYSAVSMPQTDTADTDFQQANGLSDTQEKAALSPTPIPDPLPLASAQGAGASDLQSRAQHGRLSEPAKSTDTNKTLIELLLAPVEESAPCLKDVNFEATSSRATSPSCNTKAGTVNKLIVSSLKEEASSIPAELEMSFSQMSSATLEVLESCFGLWKTTPSNIAGQSEQESNASLDPKQAVSSPGLCDQNSTVGPEISSQTSLANKSVAVVNPLVLSMSESPNNAAEMDRVRLEGSFGLFLEQNIQSTMVDSSSMPDVGVNAKGNSTLPTNNRTVPDESMKISFVCTNHSEIAFVVSSSSYDSSHQSKPDQSLEVVEKAKQLDPLDNSEAISPQTSVSCQLGSTLESNVVKVEDSPGTMKEVLNEQLLISSICTLVEGNTLYDSQIAKIFDDSSLVEGDGSKNLPEASPIELPVTIAGFGDLAHESELSADVQDSKGLTVDSDEQQGAGTINCTKSATLVADLTNINSSVTTFDKKVLVLGTKHKHGRTQTNNKFQTISAHNKKSEFRHSFSESEDVHSVSEEKDTVENVAVTNKQMEKKDHLIEPLAEDSSSSEFHIPEAHAHFKAYQIAKNDPEDDNLFETKQSDNDTSSIKETDVAQAAASDNPVIEDNMANAEGQLEKIQDSTLKEVQSHVEGTFTDYNTHNEDEPASEVTSAQGLHDQLSELLIEFPFGLDRTEHVHSLEVQGVLNNKDSLQCNSSVKQDLQVEKELKNPARNCDHRKEHCVNLAREESNVADPNWTGKSCTNSSSDVHGCEEKAINQSAESDTACQQSGFQLATNCSDSSQFITGQNKGDSLNFGPLKIAIKKEIESSEVFGCVKAELQCAEPCSLKSEIQGSGTVNSIGRNLEKNSMNKKGTRYPLQNYESLKETSSFVKCNFAEQKNKLQLNKDCNDSSKGIPGGSRVDSLNIGSVKIEIKKDKMEEPEFHNCVKQESQHHKHCSGSGMHGSVSRGLERSDCTTSRRVDKSGSTSPDAPGSAETAVKVSCAKLNAAEQQSKLELCKHPKSPFENTSNAAGLDYPSEHPEKVKIKTEKQEADISECVKQELQCLKPCSVSLGINVTGLNNSGKRSTVKRDCTTQNRVDKPLSVSQSLEKIHGSETIEGGLFKCKAEQQSKMQLSNSGSGSTTSIPGVQTPSSPDEGSVNLEIVEKMMVREIHNSTKLSGPEKENLVCQQQESCLTELKTECKLNEKANKISPVAQSSANSIIVGANNSSPVVQQESQLNDKFIISFPNINDCENDCSMNQIKITILDSENMSILFPQTLNGSVSEDKTSNIPNSAQLSAEPITNDIPTHHKLEANDNNVSGSVSKESMPSDAKTCCMYNFMYSIYAYGPKCMCIHNGAKDAKTCDSSQKSPNCKEVDADKSVNSPCAMDDSLKENVHCIKTNKEMNNLSLNGKCIKRPKPAPLDSDCKRLKTGDHVTSVQPPLKSVECNTSVQTHTGKSDLHKKKSKHEKPRKHKHEKKSKDSKLKTQASGSTITEHSQNISSINAKSYLKDPLKSILPDKKSNSPEAEQISTSIHLPVTKTKPGKEEELNKVNSELKKPKNKLKKLKSMASSCVVKSDKVNESNHKSISVDGSKRHSEKYEKRKHKHHEKKFKASTGNSCSKEERKLPNTEVKTKVLAEKYASNQEVPAKKQIEAEKACAKKDTLPQCAPLQDSDKKVLSDSENQDLDAAADKKRTLTIHEYRQRQEAEHLKAVKKNQAVLEAREAMNLHRHSHSKPETAKSNGTPSNRSCTEDKTSKCAEMISKRPVHDTTKGSPRDPASVKPHDSSSKDKQTKHDFAHSKSISKPGSVDQQFTKSSVKSSILKVGNEQNRVSAVDKNSKESSLRYPEKAAVTNTTQQAMCPKNINVDTSSGKEQWKKAFRPTLEKKEVYTSRDRPVDPRMLKFRLGPDVLLRRHSTDGEPPCGNRLARSENYAVEGIKSKKEDWYNSSSKKRKFESNEGLLPEPTTPKQGSSPERPILVKGASKHQPNIGSKTTFDTYKQRYLDNRSKSVDGAPAK